MEDQSNYLPCLADETFLATHELFVKEEKQLIINNFRSRYTYASDCNNNKERKTCIWWNDKCSWQCSWLDQSSGIIWVAVHGINSICVITRKKLDKKREGGRFFKIQPGDTIFYNFMETLIYEIENGSFHKFDQSIKKPFGIVSMIPDTNQASSKYDENAAINFLTEKMKTDSALTLDDDTIQTAISALQHLCRKKFKAHQIMGSVLKENKTYVSGLPSNQIKNHLAVVNNFLLRLPILPSPRELKKKTKRSRRITEGEDSTLLFGLKKKRTKMGSAREGGGSGGSTTISEDLSKLAIV